MCCWPCGGSFRIAASSDLSRTERRPAERCRSNLEHLPALLPFRPIPHHTRIALERNEPLAAIGPVLRLVDADMIDGLPPGAGFEQRTRDVDHLFPCTLVDQRRAAASAEAARAGVRVVLIARDLVLASPDAKALAPHTHIGGVHRTMRESARPRVVMPGPECRIVDFERDRSTEAPAGDCGGIGEFHRMSTR